METYQSQKYSYVQLSSYRTYEEWKRFSLTQSELAVLSSYRTYEEWKPF